MVRPSKKRPRGVTKYGRGAGGYGTYINVPTAVPFRPGIDRRSVGNLHVATAEKKFFDTTISLGVAATAGILEDSLNHVAQGTAENQRIGRSITIHDLHIRAHVIFPENATTSTDLYRFIVYIDTQTNGATAATTDILETADEHSYRNLANNKRFIIIRDLYQTINSLNADAASNYGAIQHTITFNWYSPEGLKIEFNSTAGNIAEIRSNNIGILWINQNGASGVDGKCRIRYSDA